MVFPKHRLRWIGVLIFVAIGHAEIGSAATSLSVTGGPLSFSYHPGVATASQSLSVISNGSPLSFTASSTDKWLIVSPNGGTTPASLGVNINAAGLPVGAYLGIISIASTGADNSPQTVQVTLRVSESAPLAFSASVLSFTYQAGGSLPSAQSLQVTADQPFGFSVISTASWATVSQASNSTPTKVTVSINPSGLAAGNYTGFLDFFAFGAGASPETVNLYLTITSPATLNLSQNALSFSYQAGGLTPSPQSVQVGSTGGALNFTASSSTSSGGAWLSLNQAGGTTPAALSVSVKPTGLGAGTYFGNVTISPTGSSSGSQSISVTLTITPAPILTASPAALNFSYQIGDPLPTTQSLLVGSTGDTLPFNSLLVMNSGGNWLGLAPGSGPTPKSLAVAVNPSGLSAGSYSAAIMLFTTGVGNSTLSVPVNLVVTAPPVPVSKIAAVVNAASFQSGAVCPGEIVTITGAGLGPLVSASLTLDQNGNVSTQLGGVQVLFNGTPAPLTYVSAVQINAVVPYEVQNISSPAVQVKYQGQTSNSFPLTLTSASPALFSSTGTGVGQVAAINQDQSYNSPANPAAKGSYLVLYLTGEGQTAPSGVTGRVTTVSATTPLTPQPVQPVSVLISGQPASVIFYGEAPGFVSGIMQINVQVPMNVPSGDLPILVTVGSNQSQTGLALSVQ